jgi:hypothetical protein
MKAPKPQMNGMDGDEEYGVLGIAEFRRSEGRPSGILSVGFRGRELQPGIEPANKVAWVTAGKLPRSLRSMRLAPPSTTIEAWVKNEDPGYFSFPRACCGTLEL